VKKIQRQTIPPVEISTVLIPLTAVGAVLEAEHLKTIVPLVAKHPHNTYTPTHSDRMLPSTMKWLSMDRLMVCRTVCVYV